jgi:A/G-specific adenine glycosylase
MLNISGRRVNAFRRVLLAWGRRNYARFPWRATRNRFHALVAEVMLQRTRAEQVLPVYREFVRRFPAPAAAASSTGRLRRLLGPLGLEWRARKIGELVRVLAVLGRVPCDPEGVRQLPGVGDYAASAFLLFHCGRPALLIDANAVRLYGRYFGLQTGPETRRAAWFRSLAAQIQPRGPTARQFGYALLDFTRAVCRPAPRCAQCPLRFGCAWFRERRHD